MGCCKLLVDVDEDGDTDRGIELALEGKLRVAWEVESCCEILTGF